MSFIQKALASIGVGAATVDTILAKSTYTTGEQITGKVKIIGGNVEQQVDAIFVTVYTTYVVENDDHKVTVPAAIAKMKVCDPLTVQAKETYEFPVQFQLPYDTPLTLGKTRVWIQTEMDIKNAIDPKDKDYIEVKPSNLANKILESVMALGFQIRKVDCENAPRHLRGSYPFVQEFEFYPTSGQFRGKLDEFEVVFLSQTATSAELLLQIDRRARGFSSFLKESMGLDESHVKLSVNESNLQSFGKTLSEVIAKFS